ncbi:hypothetical protein [Beijerinckia sp. L45]|uniref:hypothetical protein n=1 Tax=Beijerinckia sp. L45 TaxID=1641855 RepID=UPI00131CAAD6|nr:hypothetical protein [Beijerinckia sp. L45]
MGDILDFRCKDSLGLAKLPKGYDAAKARADFWARKAQETREADSALKRVEAELARHRVVGKKPTAE